MRTNPDRRDRIKKWFEERLPTSEITEYFAKKTVPRHKHSFWYYFGGLTLFFFLIQIVTGILLALYYKPGPDQAYESVQKIVNEVPHGWLIRSLHSWSANLMVGCLFVHMFSVFLMKAYRKPRELMWLSGVILLFLVLGFCFTGYLLPWDTTSYFATLIGTEVPKSLPLIGNLGVSLLKGEEEIGSETLARMYTIHIAILPLISLVLVGLHLLMSQVFGSSVPINSATAKPSIPFFPNFLYRDLIAWTIGFVSLIVLATLLPWGLDGKADPLASAPVGIRPEWYFLPLYQTLRMVPSSVIGINGELMVNGLVGILSLVWLAIPFLDRNASKEKKSGFFTLVGVFLLSYLILTIVLAYTT